MIAPGSTPLRPWLALFLTVVLLIAGTGRGWTMAAGPQEIGPTIAGVAVPICHSGDPADGPDTPQSHDCCDACALCAPAVLPAAPQVFAPHLSFNRLVQRPSALRSAVLSRQRTPRLAQAPPA